MNILGISGGVKHGNQDGAAALLVGGQLIAAAEEERFVKVKFANGLLPKNAVRFCLQQAKLDIHDINVIVFAGATYKNIDEILTRFFEFQFGFSPPVTLADHHSAHAASTYYASGWDNALVVTMDFSGDRKSTTVSVGQGDRLTIVEEIKKPNSLGIFYSAVTQYLGFERDSDEYKVMGMAAYGKPCYDFSHILEITDTGYRFHHDFIHGIRADEPSPSKQELIFDQFPLEQPPRVPGSPITQTYLDIAASAQRQFELAALQLIKQNTRRTGVNRVCLAGGAALNCLMNQKVRESKFVRAFYAPPVCSDAGLALGAAYIGAIERGERVAPLKHAYWGPQFNNDEIRLVLDRAGVTYREVDDPAGAAAQRIADGKIVGWFQGRMEFGPRALGNRSILANPQILSTRDTIARRVKFREEFRPLAPSVRHEDGAAFFEHYDDSPFMTQTFTATKHTREQAPVVVHVDQTSRLQSVYKDTNPLYHALITSVGAKAGLPMVVNTSLNSSGYPIANDPSDALRTYFSTGLDALFLANCVLDKSR